MQSNMSSKAQFSTKIGLIAATVGSAVGLGSVWRFPSEVQANGGAAFLLIYIACVFLLGIPVMLAEFSIGRGGGSDAVGSFRNLAPGKKWWFAGALAAGSGHAGHLHAGKAGHGSSHGEPDGQAHAPESHGGRFAFSDW